MYVFCTGLFIFIAQTGLALGYAIGNRESIALYQTVYQRIALVCIPLALGGYILGWNTLISFKPKQYAKRADYWHGFVWHCFKPRTKSGFALVRDMKGGHIANSYTGPHLPAYRGAGIGTIPTTR